MAWVTLVVLVAPVNLEAPVNLVAAVKRGALATLVTLRPLETP